MYVKIQSLIAHTDEGELSIDFTIYIMNVYIHYKHYHLEDEINKIT